MFAAALIPAGCMTKTSPIRETLGTLQHLAWNGNCKSTDPMTEAGKLRFFCKIEFSRFWNIQLPPSFKVCRRASSTGHLVVTELPLQWNC